MICVVVNGYAPVDESDYDAKRLETAATCQASHRRAYRPTSDPVASGYVLLCRHRSDDGVGCDAYNSGAFDMFLGKELGLARIFPWKLGTGSYTFD